ncbi:MAG: sugar phosphate isomerase/epimerase [Clostridiales bacterium]|jgi:sugar phosphate isomerase/epimerase|nr:sugar phosphate isomerase/epimerase [Clostridiales bacterium]
MKIGAQLFTLRDYEKNLDDFAETLAKVADIGYRSVQVSGTCGFEANWLAEQLRKNGLVCPVTHTNPADVANNTEMVAENHKIFGAKVVGLGSAAGIFEPETFDYKAYIGQFLPAAKKLHEHGLLLGYHNHQPEFNRIDGKNFLERFAADFPKDSFTFILDTFWIQYAGGDPAEWIRRFPGQVHCVHFKDMCVAGKDQRMAPVGSGNMNFEAAISACRDSGTEYILVEQDNCYGEDPFCCLKRSLEYLRSMGLSE